MFGHFKKNKELETLIMSINSNAANNYKDAAQEDLKEFEDKYNELKNNGKLSEKQITLYGQKINEYKIDMQEFTHKDQKPYWS